MSKTSSRKLRKREEDETNARFIQYYNLYKYIHNPDRKSVV